MNVSSVPAPPSPFPSINTQTVAKGTVPHRTRGSGLRPAQFNLCKGPPTRFAPFTDATGACVPAKENIVLSALRSLSSYVGGPAGCAAA